MSIEKKGEIKLPPDAELLDMKQYEMLQSEILYDGVPWFSNVRIRSRICENGDIIRYLSVYSYI